VTDPSDQGVITINYQWLPENYIIINRLFPVPFSNTYDDSFLVLGIASAFCVSKFPLVYSSVYTVLVIVRTRLLCAYTVTE